MELTKEEAIKEYREQWQWQAENPMLPKSKYPKFQENDVMKECYLCQFTDFTCSKCPVEWPKTHEAPSYASNIPCMASYFHDWEIAKLPEERSRLAALVRDLPVKEGKKAETSAFNVGDKVRVKKDLIVGKQYDGCCFAIGMDKHLGENGVITSNFSKDRFHLDITGCRYSWATPMLEPVVETLKEKPASPVFKVGDWVKALHTGGNFPNYGEFLKINNLERFKEKLINGSSPTEGNVYKIVAIGKHETSDSFYGPLYLIESSSGQVYIINNKRKGLELTSPPAPKFKRGDKVVPVSKEAGKPWNKWIEDNNIIHQYFKQNGFLLIDCFNSRGNSVELGCPALCGDYFLESDLIPYVEPEVKPEPVKEAFKVGDKVVPHAIHWHGWTWEKYETSKYPIPTFLRENGYLFVCGKNNDGEYLLGDNPSVGFDRFFADELTLYVEPKPINLAPKNKTIVEGTTYIIKGNKTTCIVEVNGKKFKGVAHCNSADE